VFFALKVISKQLLKDASLCPSFLQDGKMFFIEA
jgi:hypothetical protein